MTTSEHNNGPSKTSKNYAESLEFLQFLRCSVQTWRKEDSLFSKTVHKNIDKIAFFILVSFACNHELTYLGTNRIVMFLNMSFQIVMQLAVSLHSFLLFLPVVSFFNITNPDLVEQVNTKS